MKGAFLILVLLICRTLRLEEACKTSSRIKTESVDSTSQDAFVETSGDNEKLQQPLLPKPNSNKQPLMAETNPPQHASVHISPINNYHHAANTLAEQPSHQPEQGGDNNEQEIPPQESHSQHGLQSPQAPEMQSIDNKKDSSKHGKMHFQYHVIIIGGGAQMVAIMAQLSISNIQPPFRILIVEKKNVTAVGLPYDANEAKPEHLLNVFGASLVSITGDEKDFLEWLNQNERYKPAWFNFILYHALPQRIMIGKYLTDRFGEYVEQCKKKDYVVDAMNNTEAVHIEAHDAGNGYLVKLSTEDVPVHVLHVFLATGHWYRGRFKKRPKGYFESPWPAGHLLAEIKPVHIGILGAYLSGIDTVMAVAHEFGEFIDDNTNYRIKHEDYKNFEITMYSRSGYLPGVSRDDGVPVPDYEPKHLTAENISSAIQEDGDSAFDAIFKLLKHDLAEAMPSSIGELKRLHRMQPAKFFDHLDEAWYPLKDPEQTFFSEVDGVGNGRNQLHLRNLFMMAEKYLQLVRKVCDAEDFVQFKQFIAPRVVKVAINIPMTNARKLRTLIEKGYLHLKALGQNYRIDERTDGRGVAIKYWHREPDQPKKVIVEVDHDYFVDAFGQSGHIAKDPRRLTQSLLRNKLAMPIRFPYEDQDYAEEVYNDDLSADKNRNRIVPIDGKYYLEGDGVVVNTTTWRIIPPDGVSNAGNIYASGPFTLGDIVPVSYGLVAAVEIAKKAVKHLETMRGVSVGSD